MNILLIEPDISTRAAIVEALLDHTVNAVADAAAAVAAANDTAFDLVVTELALAGHSGMEFLYEFRTYDDWQNIPVIVYSTLALDDEVLRSRGWQQLGIARYLYKPKASLRQLVEVSESLYRKSTDS